ncbi:MAG: hypothetical protein ACRD0K_28575, partial [Egibacteraceae bacterium]
HMTYDEARRQVFGLVEGSLTAGLEGRPPPSVEPLVGDSPSCADAWGVPIVEEVQPGLEYNFSIEHLDEDPDAFVDVVERFWRQRGFGVTRDDNTPGVPHAFAVVEGDFNLQVFVNHDTGMVYVGGTGPCVVSPSSS